MVGPPALSIGSAHLWTKDTGGEIDRTRGRHSSERRSSAVLQKEKILTRVLELWTKTVAIIPQVIGIKFKVTQRVEQVKELIFWAIQVLWELIIEVIPPHAVFKMFFLSGRSKFINLFQPTIILSS